jgi:hypothetical protein
MTLMAFTEGDRIPQLTPVVVALVGRSHVKVAPLLLPAPLLSLHLKCPSPALGRLPRLQGHIYCHEEKPLWRTHFLLGPCPKRKIKWTNPTTLTKKAETMQQWCHRVEQRFDNNSRVLQSQKGKPNPTTQTLTGTQQSLHSTRA